MGTRIPWESHGNKNKTPTNSGMGKSGMNASPYGNGSDHYSHGNRFSRVFYCAKSPLASGLRCEHIAIFHRNWHNILKDNCRNIFVSFVKYCE